MHEGNHAVNVSAATNQKNEVTSFLQIVAVATDFIVSTLNCLIRNLNNCIKGLTFMAHHKMMRLLLDETKPDTPLQVNDGALFWHYHCLMTYKSIRQGNETPNCGTQKLIYLHNTISWQHHDLTLSPCNWSMSQLSIVEISHPVCFNFRD